MPKFTLHEMESFIANYLSSAKPPNILDASFFLLECVVNSVMRIVVYLKTAMRVDPSENRGAWAYLEHILSNFLEAVNNSKMSCIFGDDIDVTLAINCITKVVRATKQLDDVRQLPFLIIIRRLVDLIVQRMDSSEISKMTSLITSIKSPSSKRTLRNSMQRLMNNLVLKNYEGVSRGK
ncbi:PREDICTED: uncharacterized protein LOC107172821 [Diuraphis noxia]|uniref:uncharacterized protein LOC107172821 n=1 Tax=Diuraphis noxia TaxID=143948 RepID=UPI00076362CE|nr:PREDICTED: uncharacterized protein LOC107172821 [Diuraphis noxia]